MRLRAILLGLLAACAGWAQQPLDVRTALKIAGPPDSAVPLLGAGGGGSAATTRGSAMIIDLRSSLSLRNSGYRHIRGITLLVTAQEVAPGGKASVSVPSLNVAPGESFPVRMNLRLLRPISPIGPLVVVSLDGLLFDDLSFYGPNRINSRRSMTVWELEARRDRRHFRELLAARGEEGLRQALLESLARQAERPRLDVQVARGGRATAVETEKPVQFAFLNLPGAPIEPVSGAAFVKGNEARAPSVEVRNRSLRPVRYFELSWIVRDSSGREFQAGSLPASEGGQLLAPGQRNRVQQDGILRFQTAPGSPLELVGLTGFVSQVEFADGTIWIPSRRDLSDPRLSRLLAPSPEEERLTELYWRRGLAAVIAELKKFD
ncbi:MAG: hypothetical protein ACUVXB_06385 [Bryobacteraceae bacterium]